MQVPILTRLYDVWELLLLPIVGPIFFILVMIHQVELTHRAGLSSDNLTDDGACGSLVSTLPYLGVRIWAGCHQIQSFRHRLKYRRDTSHPQTRHFRFLGRMAIFGDLVVFLMFQGMGKEQFKEIFHISHHREVYLLIIMFLVAYFGSASLGWLISYLRKKLLAYFGISEEAPLEEDFENQGKYRQLNSGETAKVLPV